MLKFDYHGKNENGFFDLKWYELFLPLIAETIDLKTFVGYPFYHNKSLKLGLEKYYSIVLKKVFFFF